MTKEELEYFLVAEAQVNGYTSANVGASVDNDGNLILNSVVVANSEDNMVLDVESFSSSLREYIKNNPMTT